MAKTPAKPASPPKADEVPSPVSGDPALPAEIAAAVAAGLELDEEQQQIYDDYEQACARLAAGVS